MIKPMRDLALACAVTLAAGCAVARQDFAVLNPGTTYAPRDADSPVVLSVGDLDRAYREMGIIHVSGVTRQGYDGLNAKLRTKAREVGADAVIFLSYGTENVMSVIPFFVAIPYDVLTAQGLAVRSLDRPEHSASLPREAAPQLEPSPPASSHAQPPVPKPKPLFSFGR